MSLHMYALRTKEDSGNVITLNHDFSEDGLEKFCVWSEFGALYQWMERYVYTFKYDGIDTFNFIAIKITDAVLDELYKAVVDVLINREIGKSYKEVLFPIGEDEIRNEDINETIEFLVTAKFAISEGSTIYFGAQSLEL